MRSARLVRTRFILNNFLVGLDWGGPRTPLGYAPGTCQHPTTQFFTG